jgi:hypothetical protein
VFVVFHKANDHFIAGRNRINDMFGRIIVHRAVLDRGQLVL